VLPELMLRKPRTYTLLIDVSCQHQLGPTWSNAGCSCGSAWQLLLMSRRPASTLKPHTPYALEPEPARTHLVECWPLLWVCMPAAAHEQAEVLGSALRHGGPLPEQCHVLNDGAIVQALEGHTRRQQLPHCGKRRAGQAQDMTRCFVE
jgi:hypothetical protein